MWTLERLQRAFAEREQIHLSDSTIWEWVEAEGLHWKRQQSWFHEAEQHDPELVEKRGHSNGLCAAAAAHPGHLRGRNGTCGGQDLPWRGMEAGPNRATFEPDYGRRGKLWVHGAFEPATGQATILLSPSRDGASHIQLLERIVGEFSSDRWLVIEDNLSIHTSRMVQLALAAWPELQILFIPKYACWLSLIEPWWKQLRSLALKGKRFDNLDELTLALNQGLPYWNAHRRPYVWKKQPHAQMTLLGGFGVNRAKINLQN